MGTSENWAHFTSIYLPSWISLIPGYTETEHDGLNLELSIKQLAASHETELIISDKTSKPYDHFNFGKPIIFLPEMTSWKIEVRDTDVRMSLFVKRRSQGNLQCVILHAFQSMLKFTRYPVSS